LEFLSANEKFMRHAFSLEEKRVAVKKYLAAVKAIKLTSSEKNLP